jgi:hypothetical protein
VNSRAPSESTLIVESDPRQPASRHVSVHNLHPNLIASLGRRAQALHLLSTMFRVRVVGTGGLATEDVPDVFGRYRVLNRMALS